MEYDALIENGTWKLVDPPLGTKPISCKWVYKNKYKVDGSLDKHKARLVAKGFAQKFGMTECNPHTTPMEQNLNLTSIEAKEFEDATRFRQLVGSLNYLTTTRPDISFAIGILSRFLQKPCEGHWSTTKRVLRYLKGTQDFGIKYTQVDDFSLIGYSNSKFDGDKETRVSTPGYATSLGSGVVS
eukprot:PITA_25962